MKDVGEEIREALDDGDLETLEAVTHPDREIISLLEHPGYIKLSAAIGRYYRGAAEVNLAEGGKRNDYWVGVRAGLTFLFTLIGDSIKRLKSVDEQVPGEDDDLEPQSEFITLGGSAL